MSQHLLNICVEGKQYTILAGWDRRVKVYFLDVSTPEPDDEPDEDGCVYNSRLLDGGVSIADMKRELAELGLQAPESFFEQLEYDCRSNVGNRYAVHAGDGTFVDSIPF